MQSVLRILTAGGDLSCVFIEGPAQPLYFPVLNCLTIVFGLKYMIWPSLRLATVRKNCISCGRCTKSCPMSISVMEKVRENHFESRDCILCGSCVDTSSKKVIRYMFNSGF